MAETTTNTRAGSIRFDGAELIVRFSYSKRRFSDIKRIREARYDASEKCWRVPVHCLDRLEGMKSFGSALVEYDFDRNAVMEFAYQLAAVKNKSVQRIIENPFFVSEKDIAAAAVPIVFRASESPRGLRAQLPRYSPAKGSIEAVPGVLFCKRTRQFIFPIERLTDFVKVLRDKKVLFAVEESTGVQLKATATLRSSIIANHSQPSWEELRATFLVPFVRSFVCDETGEQGFALCECTSDQLKLLFPDIRSFTERKVRARELTENTFIEVLSAARKAEIKIWLDRESSRYLQTRQPEYQKRFSIGEEFPESLLAVALPDVFWCLDVDRKALFAIRHTISKKLDATMLRMLTSEAAQVTTPWSPDHAVFRFKDIQLANSFAALEAFAASSSISMALGDAFNRLLTDVRERQRCLDRQQQFLDMEDTAIDNLEPEYAARLFPHQRIAVRWLSENSTGLLGDDMGLGKTLSILTAYHMYFRSNRIEKILVICPQSLVGNWEREVTEWFPEYSIRGLEKGKKLQDHQLQTFAESESLHGLVINFESFRLERLYPAFVAIARNRKIMLVVDESQRVKNPTSKTFEALAAVSKFASHRYLLSGTPTPKDIADIWAQMFILDQGKRFGTNYFDWLGTVAELGNNWSEFAVTRFIPSAVEETVGRVKEVLLRRRKEAVVDLPEKLFVTRDVPLKGDQKKRYKEVRDQLLLRVSDLTGDEGYREIQSVLEEYLRAVQVASNPRLVDPQWQGEPVKFIELDSIVEEVVGAQNGKIVIWTNYLVNVAELTERYATYGVVSLTGAVPANERTSLIESFQSRTDGSPRVFIAIPAAGGVGITLTAAQSVVYLDKNWNAEQYLQSIDRVHRIGQLGTVTIINLHSSLVDVLIAKNLKKKEENQKALLGDNALRLEDSMPDRHELIAALAD